MKIEYLKKIFLINIILLLSATLTGCTETFPRCVSADNFGTNTTLTVSAYYPNKNETHSNKDNDEFLGNDKNEESSAKFSLDQVVKWRDTGLVTDGKPLHVKVSGMWTSWAKNNDRYSKSANNNEIMSMGESDDIMKIEYQDEKMTKYNNIVSMGRACGPYMSKQVSIPHCKKKITCEYLPQNDTVGKGMYSKPCWFKNGYGAYLLFKRDGDDDPNANLERMRRPKSPVVHLGYSDSEEGGKGFFELEKIIDPINCSEITGLSPGWKIYIKILDRYYWNNAGGYGIEFISGTRTASSSSIFESVRSRVRSVLDQAAKDIFNRIVNNEVFKHFVFALVTLFIVISALMYVFGLVQQSLADLLIRMLKIALVMMLISPASWDFFNDHLLALFLKGIDMIIVLVNSHTGASYNEHAPFSFMDYIIKDRIFASVVWEQKARALAASSFFGWVGLILILVSVFFYIYLCMYAFIIYLTGFVGISMLIGIMPILFIGILFSHFKNLFEGWLKQCIALGLQSIMIFTLSSLFAAFILNTYYRIFGFTACFNKWMKIEICVPFTKWCVVSHDIYSWTAGQEFNPKVISTNPNDLSVGDHPSGNSRFTFTGGGAIIKIPPEYKYKGFRYLDYPYFNPDINSDGSLVNDFNDIHLLLEALGLAKHEYAVARIIEKIRLKVEGLPQSPTKQLLKNNLFNNGDIDFVKKQLLGNFATNVLKILEKDHILAKKTDLEKQYDYNIIKSIQRGDLIIWPEILTLLFLAFLMYQLRMFVQTIGQSMSGGTPISLTLGEAYKGGVFNSMLRSIPVVGDKVDNFINSLGSSYKYFVGGGIERIGRKTLETINRVPVVGSAINFTLGAAKAVTGGSSAQETELKLNEQFKDLDYARAVVGSHLGFLGNTLGIGNSAKYLAEHMGNSIMGKSERGLFEGMKEDYKAYLEKLSDVTRGVPKLKPNTYVNRDPSTPNSPFPRVDSHVEVSLDDVRKDLDEVKKLLNDSNDDVVKLLEKKESLNEYLSGLRNKSGKEIDDLKEDVNNAQKALNDKLDEIKYKDPEQFNMILEARNAQSAVDSARNTDMLGEVISTVENRSIGQNSVVDSTGIGVLENDSSENKEEKKSNMDQVQEDIQRVKENIQQVEELQNKFKEAKEEQNDSDNHENKGASSFVQTQPKDVDNTSVTEEPTLPSNQNSFNDVNNIEKVSEKSMDGLLSKFNYDISQDAQQNNNTEEQVNSSVSQNEITQQYADNTTINEANKIASTENEPYNQQKSTSGTPSSNIPPSGVEVDNRTEVSPQFNTNDAFVATDAGGVVDTTPKVQSQFTNEDQNQFDFSIPQEKNNYGNNITSTSIDINQKVELNNDNDNILSSFKTKTKSDNSTLNDSTQEQLINGKEEHISPILPKEVERKNKISDEGLSTISSDIQVKEKDLELLETQLQECNDDDEKKELKSQMELLKREIATLKDSFK